MRKTSKIMAFIAAFIILVSMLALPANAATSVNYSVSSASGQKGDTVTVTVRVSSSIGVTSAILNVKFDNTKLQYVSGNAGSMFSTCTVRANGTSSVQCTGMTMGDSNAKKSGTFATLKFKILAESGTAALTISPSSSAGDHSGVGTPPVRLSPTVSNGKVTITKAVTGISLNKTSVSLKKGETSTLTATVTPSDATNKTVTYYTSDKYVAKVSSNGTITAVGGGTATITAKAGTKTATCKVTVSVPQSGISAYGSTSKTVEQGGKLSLRVSKVPSDATDNYSTTWTSADTGIATVSSNGVVTGVALGTTKITAKQNGWSVTYTVTVTEKATQSTTEESSTDESTTEDVTENTSELTTEITTAPTTTEPVTKPENKVSFFKIIWEEIKDENNTVTKLYHYCVVAVASVVMAAITIPVTAVVTASVYKGKIKKLSKKENDE